MAQRPRGVVLAVLAVLAFCAGAARAQEAYPSRVVTLVTPYAPGGGSDLVTRVLAEALRRYLGQVVNVQNIPGAGGNIGAANVAQARPDGYTLLSHHTGLAVAPALSANLSFDPLTSFEPVGLFADMPMVVVGGRHLAPDTMADLLAHARRHRGAVTFASSGQGSATHLCALLFERLSGGPVTMVQYRGAAPAIADLQGGRVDLLCDVPAGAVPFIQSNAVKAFVLTGSRRLESVPAVPTVSELGIAGLDIAAWYGLYAPARTPRAVVQRLAAALQAATRDPATLAQLAQMDTAAVAPAQATPDALRDRLAAQVRLWGSVIREAGIAPN